MNKKVFINYSARKWLTIVGTVIVGSAVFSYLFLRGITDNILILGTGILFAAGIFGMGTGILALLDKQRQELSLELQQAKREIQSTINVRPLTEYPLNLGGWAITAQFLDRLTREIELRKPQLIVECGSGTSTIVTAACLKQLGQGKVISFDHEEKYAEITRSLLEAEGLEEWGDVITAPLKEMEIDGMNFKWYDITEAQQFNSPIDILTIDGPPGVIQPLSRYPALPLLGKYLSENSLIMLDDGNRSDETQIAELWVKKYALSGNLIKDGRGYWIFNSRSDSEPK